MRTPLLASLFCAAGLVIASPLATPPVFSVHDLNRDGCLDRAEYAALQAACAQRRGERCRAALLPFEALDANRDGCIGEDELLNVLGRCHRGGRRDGDTPAPVIDEPRREGHEGHTMVFPLPDM